MVSINIQSGPWPSSPFQGLVPVLFTACIAIFIAPLSAYVILIALFGFAHVICELRYCDERFSARITPSIRIGIVGLVALLALLRVGEATGSIPSASGITAELVLAAALALLASFVMPAQRVTGFIIGLILAVGAVISPSAVFLALAWLHNLTPLAFVAEIVPRGERNAILLRLGAPLLILPLCVATGLPHMAVALLLAHDNAAPTTIFGVGTSPLNAYLPPMPLADAVPFFSAAVLAQAMHYFAVVALLPRLLLRYGGRKTSLCSWPSWRMFYAVLAIFSVAVLFFFAFDYHLGRSIYAIAAAVHSWIEIPLLLLAFGGLTASSAEQTRKATSLN